MTRTARILVVDDEPIVCQMSSKCLGEEGYDVTTFTDSTEAWAALEREHFDVVITDLKMKGIDGMELLELVRERNPDCKVIMLTAFGSLETAAEAHRKEAFEFLTKPVRISDLLECVRRAIGGQEE